MNRQEYINMYKQKLNLVPDIFRCLYHIDDENVYYDFSFDGQRKYKYSYPIDKIVKLHKFYNEFYMYMMSINEGDEIETEDGRYKVVKRKENPILSFVCDDKIVAYTDVVYRNVKFDDVYTVMSHFFKFLFFDNDICRLADIILEKIDER